MHAYLGWLWSLGYLCRVSLEGKYNPFSYSNLLTGTCKTVHYKKQVLKNFYLSINICHKKRRSHQIPFLSFTAMAPYRNLFMHYMTDKQWNSDAYLKVCACAPSDLNVTWLWWCIKTHSPPQSSVAWYTSTTQYSPLKVNGYFGCSACYLLRAGFLLDLFFEPEDGLHGVI
jgi:hypothetical protein